jgi:phosphoesterase RecJ-like protein
MSNELNALNEKIRNANSIVIMGHKNVDGDALASVLAMGHFCRNEFQKDPMLAFEGVIPDNLRFLSNGWWLKKAEDIKETPFDLAISVDMADSETLLEESGRNVLSAAKDRIKIDHHQNSKEIDGLNIIKPSLSATSEIIANIAFENGWNMTPAIARFLYAGIFTDTGGFTYDYTSADSMRLVARLMETGFDHTEVVRRLFEKKKETFLNNAETLARTLFSDDGKIAYTTFSIKKANEKDRPHRETDWLHKQIMLVKDLEACVIFKEMMDGKIQGSIRSRMKPVNGFAEQFGGGGHLLAAGFPFDGTMAEAVAQIIPKLSLFLNESKRV